MSEDSTKHSVCSSPGNFSGSQLEVAQFDQREGSSDGGAPPLKAADRHYGLVAGLASCLRDAAAAGKVDHSLRELVGQLVFSMAGGYRTRTIRPACPRIRFNSLLDCDPI